MYNIMIPPRVNASGTISRVGNPIDVHDVMKYDSPLSVSVESRE